MKLNQKISKISKLPLIIFPSLITPLISGACNTQQQIKSIDEKQIEIKKVSTGAIKYLAIGDDYAIGHNNTRNSRNNNFFDQEKNEVYGISYPSYLANTILELKDEKTTLSEYQNFGVANSKIENWLYLLNPEIHRNQNKKFEQIKQLNKSLNLINADLTAKKVIEAIKNANLLTISIGFNDIFKKHEILAFIFSDEEKIFEEIKNFKEKINQRIETLKANYLTLVNEIKKINQNININLIGFLSPFLHAINLRDNQELNEVLKNATKQLNKTIQSVAIEKNLNFYSFENKNYIWENINKFATDFFSFLPNKNAYKKLAQDIIAKVLIKNKEYNNLFHNKTRSSHSNAIDFSKKSTTIKSYLFGINNPNEDAFIKEFAFEKNQENQKIISSEEKNLSIDFLLQELKNNLIAASDNELNDLIKNILTILGISNKEVYQTFLLITKSPGATKKIEAVKELFIQILNAKTTKNLLVEANSEILQLLIKQSHLHTSIKSIKNIIKNQWLKNNHSYFLIKDFLNEEYLKNNNNLKFLETNLAKIIDAFFHKQIINKVFPNQLKEIIFNNISLKNEFDFVIKKITSNLLNTSKRENYFKNKEFEDFIKDVLIDVKKEFSNLLTKSINHIKSNKELFEKTIKTITTQIKTVYQINLDKKINSIEYFIFNLFDSLEFNANKKDNLGYELIDIFIKSLILKTNKNKKITRNFFEVLALNNQVEYNEKNQVFFKLINYLPNKNNLDKSKYLEGMKYLGTSLIKIDEFFNPTEINDLITNQTSLFNFFKNLSNYQKISKNTDETKKHFQDFISLIIDESLNNNFIKQLIDKFGSYLIINPMLSYLKNNHLEKEILDLNPNFENIEDLVKDWYKGLYQLIASKEIINKLKTFIHNLIFDENKHKKEGLEKFIISILENKDENGLLDLIKEITNQITTNKYGTSFLVDILIKSLNKKFKINLDENIKKELLENINQIIRNLPNSDFLKTWIKNLIEIIKTINVENKEQSKINKIQKVFNWLFSNSSQKIITEEIIKNFFALLEIDDKKNDQSQSQKINFSLKLLKIIIEKIENVNDESVKNEIKKLFNSFLTNSIVKKMIQNQTNRLEKTILKENAEAEEFAKETINKINKIIFDQEINNEVINSVVTGILNIKKEKIGDINNWSQLFKKIIDKKQLNLKSFINKTINKLNSDQEYINKLFSFLLTTINKKYDFEATGDETKNIANFLAKLTLNLKKENEIAGIVEEFASVLINDLFNNKNANQQIEKEFFKTLKKIEYKSIFTKNFFEKITKAFFDKNVNKEEFTNQLLAIYNYLSRNLPKIKQFKQTYSSKILLANSNNNNNNYSKDNEEILVNFLNSFNNLFIGEKNTAKEVFIEITHKIIQNQIKQAITSSDPRLNILLTLIKNTHFKKLVDSVINEFLNQKNQIHSNSKDIISNIVEKISTKLKSEFKNIIKGFSNDQNLIKVVVNNLIDFLNLKDTNSNDKELLEKVIKESINHLIDTDYFKTKIVKRTTEHFSLFSKQFDVSNPFQWIIEFAKKIKSGFSFKDLGILSELVGKDKPINGNILVRLINLIFEKSNLEKSSLYDALRNINMDDDRSKRTNMQTLNDQISIGSIFSSNKNSNQLDDPNNISPEIDLLKLLDNIFKILHLEYEKNPKTKESNFYVKSQTDEWKAIYRLKVAFDFFIFEMFGRETLTKDRDNWSKINLYSGTRAILWELQEGENISWIPGINNKFSGMQTYFKDPEERRQFTNYLIKDNGIWPFRKTEYFDEDTYGPESITYIIVTSGYNKEEKNNQPTEFKYKIDLNNNKKITKKEYILLTLKEGGYAKFMKLNNHTSKSEWSGLNKVEFNNIQPNK